MTAVIRITGRVDGSPVAAGYLVMFDFDANYGAGELTTSLDRDHALLFPDKAAAKEFCERAARWRAIKPDGEPNRPLTAYSVTIEELAQQSGDQQADRSPH